MQQQMTQTTKQARVVTGSLPVAWPKGNIIQTMLSTRSPIAAMSATTSRTRLQKPASRALTITT